MNRKILLWVDSYRNPRDIANKAKFSILKKCNNYAIVHIYNFEEFTGWIRKYGIPTVISITNHVNREEAASCKGFFNRDTNTLMPAVEFAEYRGIKFLLWLASYCLQKGLEFPEIDAHSPVEEKNKELLKFVYNYRKNIKTNNGQKQK